MAKAPKKTSTGRIKARKVMVEKIEAASDRLEAITKVAGNYGARSFDNYAQIRNLAETLRDGLCEWLRSGDKCVYLVPPEGAFGAQDYRSAAFSVTGKGYLPLKPISFGLAVRISEDTDYMRLKINARKEGSSFFITLDKKVRPLRIAMPISIESLEPTYEAIYDHIIDFFQDRIDEYDNGDYGQSEIGFDIQRATT